jgi:hypothetical protein
MARQGKKSSSSSSLSCNNKQTDRKLHMPIFSYIVRLLQSNLGLYAYNSLHLVCMMENYCRQCRYRLALMFMYMLLLAFDRENINLVGKIIHHFFLLLLLFFNIFVLHD